MSDGDRTMGRGLMRPLGVMGALALMLSACGNDAHLSDAEYLARAKEHQEENDLRASVIELKNALGQNTNNVEARWLLGQIYADMGSGEAAEKELLKAEELGIGRAAVVAPLGRALALQADYDRLLKEIEPVAGLSVKDEAEVHALRGEAHLAKRQLQEAEKEYRTALGLDAGSVRGTLGHAQLAMIKGDNATAHTWIDKAIDSSPKAADAWGLRGDLTRLEGKPKEAVAAYGKAIEFSPNPAPLHLRRALTRLALKDTEGAKEDLEALKKIAPQHPGTFHVEGLLELMGSRHAEAQSAFEQVLRRDSRYLPAIYYLGVTHYLQNHVQQAEEHLKKVLTMQPAAADVRLLLAQLKLRQGDNAAAKGLVMPVVARDANNVAALGVLGHVEMALGNTDAGIAYLQKVVALNPESAPQRVRLGLGMLASGEHLLGVEEIETAIEIDPKFQQADLLLVIAHLSARHYDDAIKAATALREKQPKNPAGYNLIAAAHLGKGEADKASAAYREALKVAPGDPLATRHLALLLERDKQVDKARALYRAALEERPDNADLLLNMASFEERQGQAGAAKAAIEKAMKNSPDNLAPRLRLARIYLNTGQAAQALNVLKEVQDQSGRNPVFLELYGESLLALGETTHALHTFQDLVQASPKAAQAHYLLAKAQLAAGDRKAAKRELDQAVTLEPNHLAANVSLIRLTMLDKQPAAANRLLADLRKAYPNNPEVVGLEAWLALHQNRPKEAAAAFKEALRSGQNSRLALDLAQAQWETRDWKGTLATLREWLKTHPDDAAVRYQLGSYHLVLNQTKEARAAFNKVVEVVPEHGPALNNLAWVMRHDDPAKAQQLAERALTVMPNDVAVMDTLGLILLERKDIERAQRTLRSALDRAPANPILAFHYAQALAQGGQRDEARNLLQKALASKQPFVERREAQAMLDKLGS